MAYKCCVVHCCSNYSREEPVVGFCFPKGEALEKDEWNRRIFCKNISKLSITLRGRNSREEKVSRGKKFAKFQG